jgi:hypothetical protein
MKKFDQSIGERLSRFTSKLLTVIAVIFLGLTGPATAIAQNATPVAVTPSSASGSEQMFTATFTDENGGSDAESISLYIMNGVAPGARTGWSANECVLLYSIHTGIIQIVQDSGGSFAPVTATAGSSGTVSNSQCAVIAAASSASVSGNTLTVNMFVTFTPAFSGAKQLYLEAVDNENNFSTNFQTLFGTYNVTSTLSPISVSPSSASGSEQMFTATYSDVSAGIQEVILGFNSLANSIAGPNQCQVRYDVATGNIWLMPDAATSWGTSSVKVGSSSTLSNSQCAVLAAASSASLSGSTLTVNVFVTFTPAYAGTKQIALQGQDVNGNWTTNEISYGTYTVTSTLSPISVSPSSASGSQQMFTTTFSDMTTNIQEVILGFNSSANSIAGANQCQVRYDVATGAIWLMPDAATSWGSSSIGAGSSGTISNSQCTVIASGSYATLSGTTLTVNVAIAFMPTYAGVKQIALQGEDVNGNWTTNEISYGTYNVTAGPTIIGFTPTAGAATGTVTITGKGFGPTQGTSTVTFNGVTASPTSWSATSITMPVPSSATSGSIVVTVNGTAAQSPIIFNVIPSGGSSALSIILSLTTGPPQMGLVISAATGSHFGTAQGQVKFNGTPMPIVPNGWTDSAITVQVPATGASSGSIVVTTGGAISTPAQFTVTTPFGCST